ncbi:MAG: helix-turn-helix domain-containing protein [Candidatus Hodarchaeota archaeon]
MRFALQKGYFDCPKKIKIRQVALYFDISISTASEILHRDVKKILRDFFSVTTIFYYEIRFYFDNWNTYNVGNVLP